MNVDDAIVRYGHVLVGNDFPGLGVEHVGMDELDSSGVMCEFGGEIGGSGIFDLILRG